MLGRTLGVVLCCAAVACGSDEDAGGDPPGDAGGGGDGVCPSSGVSKGPWSLAVTGSSAVVRWEACQAGVSPKLSLTPEAGGSAVEVEASVTETEVTGSFEPILKPDAAPDVAGTYWVHEAALDGLTPATCYSYALAADASATGRLCTARASGDTFRFAAIGDTHPGFTDQAGRLMDQTIAEGFDFSVHAGDIQYYSGALESWTTWFQGMGPWLAQGAFYPSIGNHEFEDQNPTEYEDYFVRLFHGAGFDGTDRYYRFESGGVWFFALDTEGDVAAGSEQAQWFEAQLADAAAQPGYRFSVVFFHKPFVTCGDTSQNSGARAHYQPLFQQYDVLLVLQGHMHGYERFEIDGVTYITTAGGGGLMGDVSENDTRAECALREAAGPWYHAMLFEVGATTLSGRAIDADGQALDSFEHALP